MKKLPVLFTMIIVVALFSGCLSTEGTTNNIDDNNLPSSSPSDNNTPNESEQVILTNNIKIMVELGEIEGYNNIGYIEYTITETQIEDVDTIILDKSDELYENDIGVLLEWTRKGGNLIAVESWSLLEGFGFRLIYSFNVPSQSNDGTFGREYSIVQMHLPTSLETMSFGRVYEVEMENPYFEWDIGLISESPEYLVGKSYIFYTETDDNIILFGSFFDIDEFVALSKDIVNYIENHNMY